MRPPSWLAGPSQPWPRGLQWGQWCSAVQSVSARNGSVSHIALPCREWGDRQNLSRHRVCVSLPQPLYRRVLVSRRDPHWPSECSDRPCGDLGCREADEPDVEKSAKAALGYLAAQRADWPTKSRSTCCCPTRPLRSFRDARGGATLRAKEPGRLVGRPLIQFYSGNRLDEEKAATTWTSERSLSSC
jgi:hypothetical protein